MRRVKESEKGPLPWREDQTAQASQPQQGMKSPAETDRMEETNRMAMALRNRQRTISRSAAEWLWGPSSALKLWQSRNGYWKYPITAIDIRVSLRGCDQGRDYPWIAPSHITQASSSIHDAIGLVVPPKPAVSYAPLLTDVPFPIIGTRGVFQLLDERTDQPPLVRRN